MNQSLSAIWSELELVARDHHVVAMGVSPLEERHADLFADWLARGHGGSMEYLKRHLAVRQSPQERYPWARSVIAIAVPYSSKRDGTVGTLAAHIARYAQGDDYHDVLDEILRALEARINAFDSSVKTWRYVDTGPLSDRSMAAQAGLGWIGKNGMLLNQEFGSYFFIGLLLTSLEHDGETSAVTDRCGSCTRCIEACPTDAILPDRTVDSNRCISHATIEQRGAISDEMKSRLGHNLFGCDICQEVCPWNRFAPEGHPRFDTREEYRATPISDLLRTDQSWFSNIFRKSAVKRAKRVGMMRNAIVMDESLEAEITESDEGVVDALRWRRG
jgi:epoxyqueuosine reductase